MHNFTKLGSNSPLIARVRSLGTRKHSEKEGLFVIEGKKALLETLADPKFSKLLKYIVLRDDSDSGAASAASADAAFAKKIACESAGKCDKIYSASAQTFARMSGTETPEGALAVCEIPAYSLGAIMAEGGPKLFVLLDSVADPGNLGTIIRLSDNFGASAVLLTPNSVYEYSGKVVRATMGSFRNVPVIRLSNSETMEIEKISRAGECAVVLSELGGNVPIGELKTALGDGTRTVIFIAGSESHGIVSPWIEKLVASAYRSIKSHIPSRGKNESLNISVACAIYCYELGRALFGTRPDAG